MELAGRESLLSYCRGEQHPDLWPLSVGQALDRTAERSPDRPGLIVRQSNDRFTWAELRHEAETVGRALMALGVEKGHRIGIWSTNITEWVITQLAAAKVGAILVNLNLRFRAHELEYALKHSECQSLVLMNGFRDCDYVESLFSIAPELRGREPGSATPSPRLPHLRNLIYVGENAPPSMLRWDGMRAMAGRTTVEALRKREAGLAALDPVNIQYTSGTTGFPKGATLSHYNIVNNGLLMAGRMRLTDQDKVCIPVPFYHCFGMVLGNMVCLTSGAAMVIPHEYFDPLETLKTVAEERCTALYGVPTMFIAEFQHPEFKRFDLTTLRTGIMAGSNCPIELMRRVVEEMHCPELTTVYGLTEASPGITQTTPDASLEVRVGTVGRALPHTEVKIIDPQTGATVPRGVNGELCTRGYLVMNGYYNDPESTAQTIEPDGWLHSGDLAVMDENNYIRITGRIKEMIIRGGENIYPREIEEFLHTCPAIADAQVVGVPDAKFGEAVMAWIQLKSGFQMTEEEVKRFCKGQIADFKIPRYIRFVDSFPMTVSGKVQKFSMREAFIAESEAALPEEPIAASA
jgi:fatty-acyl-CoA synthase